MFVTFTKRKENTVSKYSTISTQLHIVTDYSLWDIERSVFVTETFKFSAR
jgi:hypothetical protein